MSHPTAHITPTLSQTPAKAVPATTCPAASTRPCSGVKEHNAKYVFVSGNVYNVGNQDFAALQEHAGHTVRLTGEMSGDTITVSKIAMPGKK
jgi:hypothetical protein